MPESGYKSGTSKINVKTNKKYLQKNAVHSLFSVIDAMVIRVEKDLFKNQHNPREIIF